MSAEHPTPEAAGTVAALAGERGIEVAVALNQFRMLGFKGTRTDTPLTQIQVDRLRKALAKLPPNRSPVKATPPTPTPAGPPPPPPVVVDPPPPPPTRVVSPPAPPVPAPSVSPPPITVSLPPADDTGAHVYQVATEVNTSYAQVIAACQELGYVSITSPLQPLTAAQARAVRVRLAHVVSPSPPVPPASVPLPPPLPPPAPPSVSPEPRGRSVSRLAQELGITNQRGLDACAALGFEGVWLHHHTLTAEQERALRDWMKHPHYKPVPVAPVPRVMPPPPPRVSVPPPPPPVVTVSQPAREIRQKSTDTVRVFNLAKELKLGNLALVAICQELGFEKVVNQLNSLTP